MEDTTYYWHKVLKLDEIPNPKLLERFKYPHRHLRPLLFAFFGLLAKGYFRTVVSGQENIPQKGPYIIAPNHCSALDFPMVAWAMGKAAYDLHTITTRHFYDNPFSRFFIKIATNTFRVDTKGDFLPALQAAADILRLGKSIYMHPEGTRSRTGELLPFKVGVGVLAVEVNVPIVPVYISNTFQAMSPKTLLPKPVKLGVHFGKVVDPVPYRKMKGEKEPYYIYKEITEELRNRILALKMLYPIA